MHAGKCGRLGHLDLTVEVLGAQADGPDRSHESTVACWARIRTASGVSCSFLYWRPRRGSAGCASSVRKAFLDNYEIRQVGGQTILEYWIPA